jgi:acetyl esterase/lipase
MFNFDTTRIILTGGSAGGHLALITGMLPPNSIFDRQCPTNDSIRWNSGIEPQVKVAAIVNWFGITDVEELLDGPDAKHYAIEWFGSMSNREMLAKELSPISYVRPGLPPIVTLHGDKDDIVPYSQAVRLHAALDKAGVPNQLVTIHGGKHGGFTRKELIDSFDAIRDFLIKNHILTLESSK